MKLLREAKEKKSSSTNGQAIKPIKPYQSVKPLRFFLTNSFPRQIVPFNNFVSCLSKHKKMKLEYDKLVFIRPFTPGAISPPCIYDYMLPQMGNTSIALCTCTA